MLSPSITRRLRRLLVLLATCAVLAPLVGVIAIVLESRPPEDSDHTRNTRLPLVSATPETAEPAQARTMPGSADPREFVRDVAVAIFRWDTRTASEPAELVEPFLTIADPTGESSPGLVSDLTGYLPTQAAWEDLRRYETRQRLDVTAISVPTLWASAVEQAEGELAPGTAALTVHGTRHREGIWEGRPVTSEHGVAFTVFVVCAPTYPTCHLLRLSRLDDPLE